VTIVSTTIVLLLTDGLPSPARFLLTVAASTALGLGVFLVALPPRTRQALETFAWIGERDLDRFIRETRSYPPTSAKAARTWLEQHPESADNAGHRVDVLLAAGELEPARSTAERRPSSTPWERFLREVQLDYVDG
jgi:hypothetical protein